ncbi:MAG TPA: acetyl-CoA carboxylase biotin carboxylase subunit [Candidatus Dormibacteraeota bacterium]|jgi:pyruvate carboxylase subunit A|nr:acetyl-CoA carboxylase biotin carboxylase subunit [Candidatus Dormibacteraeota bacterium]
MARKPVAAPGRRPIRKVLVANRGEIAVRVMRACREMGIATVAVHSEADAGALFVKYADEAVAIGPPSPSMSYLVKERIVEAAQQTGADAIHPGYGFLSEKADFVRMCDAAGITFIGPPAAAMDRMGDKVRARETVSAAGVPIVPGTPPITDPEEGRAFAAKVGFPVLVKAAAGGGGIGMKVVEREADLLPAIESCQSTARSAFGDPTIFIEKYVAEPRHVEIQVIADAHGNVVHLGERECSIQRRHQKLIEESPSPAVTPEIRERMGRAAVEAARACGYVNAGTIEFIFSRGDFYFLEMNTRLQVEHPVTELVTGIDLVRTQLRVAMGEALPFTQADVRQNGWAMEFRVNAEDPARDFMPAPGRIGRYHEPGGIGVRVDSGVYAGYTIPPYYDSMIAKLIVWAGTRDEAVDRGRRALREYVVGGVRTNMPLHLAITEAADFRAGRLSTHFIPDHPEVMARAAEIAAEGPALDLGAGDAVRVAAIAAAVQHHAAVAG